jgi:hypothetical protein
MLKRVVFNNGPLFFMKAMREAGVRLIKHAEGQLTNMKTEANYIVRVIITIALMLSLAPLSFAVTQAKRRSCTVNLIGGGAVSGYFIGANSSRVIVEVDGVRKTIKLDHVANILFTVDFKNRRMRDVEP